MDYKLIYFVALIFIFCNKEKPNFKNAVNMQPQTQQSIQRLNLDTILTDSARTKAIISAFKKNYRDNISLSEFTQILDTKSWVTRKALEIDVFGHTGIGKSWADSIDIRFISEKYLLRLPLNKNPQSHEYCINFIIQYTDTTCKKWPQNTISLLYAALSKSSSVDPWISKVIIHRAILYPLNI